MGRTKKIEIIELYSNMFIGGMFIPELTPPEGEDFTAFKNRVMWLKEKLLSESSEHIIVCSHNQFLKLLFHIMQNDNNLSRWREITFQNNILIELNNCC